MSRGHPRTAIVANGAPGSAGVERATRIAAAVPGKTAVYTRSGSRARDTRRLTQDIRSFDPDVIYCVDLAAVPLAVALAAPKRSRVIVDTGDYPSAFLRHIRSSKLAIGTAVLMEEVAYRKASAFVVRGRHHAAVLRGHGVRHVEVIPDGVDLDVVTDSPDPALRARLGLSDGLTFGIAGHFTWYDSLDGGLGWELVQALALLADLPIRGVLIGHGPGLARLRVLAHELGVSDRLHILGRVPYKAYSRYLGLIDVCLLTQTNDRSSWIRTTGKLPGYMAAGRYVLASAVGTAVDVLPEAMLVPYHGRWDPTYPAKLAERLTAIVDDPAILDERRSLRPLAAQFDYRVVARKAACLIEQVAARA